MTSPGHSTPSSDEIALAERLFAEWDGGAGTSKGRIEIREWGDATSHGRRFDRFIRRTLGRSTSRASRQTNRIGDLESQLRQLGVTPTGTVAQPWEPQLQHARVACLAALRAWNDPTATFRTGTFSLLFVAAWNSLAIAKLQKDGKEWRSLDDSGVPVLRNGVEESRWTVDLVSEAFSGGSRTGLCENVRDWVELRNSVAHRHLLALDAAVIPLAQAGLLNFETVLSVEFGEEWALAEHLSVPLQLAGFRDPGVLKSLKILQASLPLDVQAILARASTSNPDLLADQTYQLRVAFVPVVPASGRSPDAVAYFVRPGDVTDELADALDRYVVVPKVLQAPPRPNLGAKTVVRDVESRIPWRLTVSQHARLTHTLGVRPPSTDADPTRTDSRYCEYVPAVKLHLYNQAWVNRLVDVLTGKEDYEALLGCSPRLKAAPPAPIDQSLDEAPPGSGQNKA
ncbi:MAG: DUF3644 domain-containing protein [Acidobacteriaceae bacterium]